MIVLKITAKILVIPVMIIVLIAQGIGTFFTGIASVVLGILSTIFWGCSIVGFVFGALTGHEALEMMAVAFAVFIIPQICGCLIGVLGAFQDALIGFIRS